MTLYEFLVEILGIGGGTGALSYPVALWLFGQVSFSSGNKRFLAYVISFGLAGLAWALVWLLGYAEITPDAVFYSMAVAFSTSQAIHGAIELSGSEK